MDAPKILIIGAGAAGIAAGTRLIGNGFYDVTILEASTRIGGRVMTEKFGQHFIDLGAQWCHGEKDNVVYELAQSHDLLAPSIYDFSQSLFVNSSGEILPREISLKLQSVFHNMLSDKEALKKFNKSLGEFIHEKLKFNQEYKEVDPIIQQLFLDWYEKMEDSLEAANSWFETSAKGLTEYWDCPGKHLLNWKERGTKTVLDLLMKNIPDVNKKVPIKDKILFNKTVCNVTWNISNSGKSSSPKVRVSCLDGTQFEADLVILTVSLGVLKENINTLFSPSLPEFKTKAIQGLNLGTVNKIFLKFNFCWWPNDFHGISFLWKESDKKRLDQLFGGSNEKNNWIIDLFGFYPVDNVPNVLLGWIVHESARKMELLSDIDIIETCTKLLKLFVGRKYDIPNPVEMIRSKWYTNPHFRGSYSYRSMKTEEMCTSAAELAKPLRNDFGQEVVLFAGEATHDHYYSTVHGAVGSGWREADRIIAFYKNELVQKTKIIIVGAGIAGLSAAKTICESGCKDFIVLEAQNQLGGRIQTASFGKNFVEVGANWLHGNKNTLYNFCQDHNLLSDQISQEASGVYIREDGQIIDEFLVSVVSFKVGEILEECEHFNGKEAVFPMSVGDYLVKNFEVYLKACVDDSPEIIATKRQLLDWHIRFQTIDNSCRDLFKLSMKAWGEYFCSSDSGQTHINFKNGFSSVVNALSDYIPSDNILLNKIVNKINWKNNDNNVKVICEDGSRYEADFILVTVSLGVLKEIHESVFLPHLPQHFNQIIKNMGFGGITKIFLEFDKKWWNVKGFQLIWEKPYSVEETDDWTKYISGFDEVINNSNVLLGWVGGKGAEIVENIDECVIGMNCVDLLKKFTQRRDIPLPVRVLRTKWNSNPYIRGAYGHTTSICDFFNLEARSFNEHLLNKSANPVMAFAGEAWHPTSYSTTHGAFESGEVQAKCALKSLGIFTSNNILNSDKNKQKINSRL